MRFGKHGMRMTSKRCERRRLERKRKEQKDIKVIGMVMVDDKLVIPFSFLM